MKATAPLPRDGERTCVGVGGGFGVDFWEIVGAGLDGGVWKASLVGETKGYWLAVGVGEAAGESRTVDWERLESCAGRGTYGVEYTTWSSSLWTSSALWKPSSEALVGSGSVNWERWERWEKWERRGLEMSRLG